MRTRIVYALMLLCTGLPTLAQAQDDDRDRDRDDRRGRGRGLREVPDHAGRSRRQGFWLSVGIGVGGESFDARDGLGWSDDKTGGVGYIKLGGTVSPNVLLGVEAQGWTAQYYGQGYDRELGSLMGIVQWYPAATGDFWLRGGLGWARDNLRYYGTPPSTITTGRNGTAFAIGLGYDARVGRKVSITPTFDLMAQRYDSHRERVVSLGVGVTFH
jgi:hypothetical protein